MQELELTPATIILAVIIIALMVLAIRRMMRRGMCDCHGDECGHGGKAACSHCSAAADMVARMDEAAKDTRHTDGA